MQKLIITLWIHNQYFKAVLSQRTVCQYFIYC